MLEKRESGDGYDWEGKKSRRGIKLKKLLSLKKDPLMLVKQVWYSVRIYIQQFFLKTPFKPTVFETKGN